ncbi:MAG: hypothetical protein IJ165_04515 [Proteobacteria bacterium]|nr:hypothetical protein [Pseudomonadota bacterium]
MNKRLSRLGLSLAMCLGLLSPLDAAASTAKDWTTASSLTATSFDSADTLAMNISRCRGLFDISTGEVSFLFTLSATAEISPDAVFTIKYAKGNESCNDKSLDAEPSDACISIANKQPLTASSSPIDVRRAVDSLSSATNADACENLNESAYLYLIVSDPTAAGIENIYTVKYTLNFRTTRPDAPSGLTATAGGESIKVSWDATKGATSYKIYYGTEGIVMSAGATPESLKGVSSATSSTNSSTLKDKITSDKTYMISVTSVDANGNESLLGEVITTDTVASKDFWQSYREENADVDGGFCFIATAAYGSTQEPHVKILRQFRDTVLLQSEPGKKFVETYYRLSPPAAYFIGQHPFLRAVTRTALWPLYGFAYLLMNMPAVLYSILSLFAAGIGFLIYRRTRRRNAATTKAAAILLGSALAGGALCAPADAFAESPVNMMAEFKAGPYTPDNLGNAFSSHFGDNGGFIIEGEYDWQFWRGVGSLGLGFHLAYGNIKGNATEESGGKSVDTTELHWLPLRLSLVYRFDYLWTRFDFPFTIYVKAGFDYAVWWINNGAGDIAKSEDGKSGYGGTFGFHVVAGIAFVLDWLAPDMEKAFDVEWGINNSYIFAEYMYAQIDNFGAGGVLDLTDKATFHIGIGLEF